MKRFLILVVFFSVTLFVIGQSGYNILKNTQLEISNTRPFSSKEINGYYKYINTIKYIDQKVRDRKYVKTIYEFRYVDSLIFINIQNAFRNGEFISLQKEKLSFYLKNVDEFLTTNFVLQLHFSDRFAFPYMKIIESSLKKKNCNELDLMNYFVTYLWRKTEFIYEKMLGVPYHIVLLPNFENGIYSKYYKYAMNCYFQFCRKYDSLFFYLQLANIKVVNGKIYTDDYCLINTITEITPILRKAIDWKMDIIKKWIYFSNALKIEDGTYNIVICTHPNGSGYPPYLY